MTDMLNTISVNHIQSKLISASQRTSYFQPKFVEKLFSIGQLAYTFEVEDEVPLSISS